jgi:hypothetical protein
MFNEHVNEIHNKAIRMFGFLKHNCWEFDDPICLYILYFSLMQSILGYGSIIWNPHQEYLINNWNECKIDFYIFRRIK